MSVRAIAIVFKQSKSKLAARLVLIALADAAHDDGVTWMTQVDLARKCLLSEREVNRSIKDLQALGEIEMRKAQRGRNRICVYRLMFTGIPDPCVEDLPFTLVESFTTGQIVLPKLSGSLADDQTSTTVTTRHLVHPNEDESLLALRPLSLNRNSNRASRKEDPIFKTLKAIFNADPKGQELKRWFVAISSLKQAEATPDDVRAAAAAYSVAFPNATMTVMALATNWTTLTSKGKTPAELAADRVRDRIRVQEGT